MSGAPRPRLVERLARLWDHRLGLVVGPAGSGKSTLLAQFAALQPPTVRVAWYRAEDADRGEPQLLGHLERAFSPTSAKASWASVEHAVAEIERACDSPTVLVVDDLHHLRGSAAERAFERVLTNLPANVVVLAGARAAPALNLSRLRVSGDLLELGPDDLRFRSWEVEELFNDFYGEPLAPADLAALARQTEGWAAALQLFHLATSGKSPQDKRRVLSGLSTRWRLTHEYLAENVLGDLPDEMRAFLTGTAVLGRMTPATCDQLLGRNDSAAMLEELERRQIFTTRLDDDSFRYHEVLRRHLEAALLGEVGEAAVQTRYRKAAALLEAAGAMSDALHAYCRAGDRESAIRLLGREGEHLAGASAGWLDALPAEFIEADPWLLLAHARQLLAAGDLPAAAAAYRRAEVAAGRSPLGDTCRRERGSVTGWLEPGYEPPIPWVRLIRAATRRDPSAAVADAARLPGLTGRFAEGVARHLANDPSARDLLTEVGEHVDAPPLLSLASRFLAARTLLTTDLDTARDELSQVADDADRDGAGWLMRLARATLEATSTDDPATARCVSARLGENNDAWGEAFVLLDAGTVAGDTALLADAARRFALLGAPVLEARALAAVRRPTVPPRRRMPAGLMNPASAVTLRCFGGFVLEVDGRDIDLSAVKPRARSALRLLAVHNAGAVHREALIEALWPDADPRAATRSLQVAVSSLRQLIDSESTGVGISRDGDAYRLEVPAGADYDITRFEHAWAAATAAQAAGDHDTMRAELSEVLAVYTGELLPEEGPAEWVVKDRDRFRIRAADAAERLADVMGGQGATAQVVSACERGLEIDPYRDGLWRRLLEAHEAAAEPAAAARARQGWDRALAELGLPTSTST